MKLPDAENEAPNCLQPTPSRQASSTSISGQPTRSLGVRVIDLATNVRRLMARSGMTQQELVVTAGVSQRTLKAILSNRGKPHARTLHRLARGLGVPPDELFQTSSSLAHRHFDQCTNPLIDQLVTERPELFENWTVAEFDELYSRFGTGGALTADGAAEAVLAMNRKREVHHKVALILETQEAGLLVDLVGLLYQRVLVAHR